MPEGNLNVRVVPADDGGCTINGCDKPVHARGWCIGHYQRWRRTGDPGPPLPDRTPAARFTAKIRHEGDCWLWTGNTTGTSGYGRFHDQGRMHVAHRWSYEHHVGPIPDGLQLDHLCRNRACVNPDHLEPVDNRENVMRAVRLRTHCKNGHKYPDGKTRCDVCRRETQRRWEARQRRKDERDVA